MTFKIGVWDELGVISGMLLFLRNYKTAQSRDSYLSFILFYGQQSLRMCIFFFGMRPNTENLQSKSFLLFFSSYSDNVKPYVCYWVMPFEWFKTSCSYKILGVFCCCCYSCCCCCCCCFVFCFQNAQADFAQTLFNARINTLNCHIFSLIVTQRRFLYVMDIFSLYNECKYYLFLPEPLRKVKVLTILYLFFYCH